MRTTQIVVISLIVFTQLGCASLKQWAEPHVCDCEPEVMEARSDCQQEMLTEAATAVLAYQLDQAHYRAATNVDELAAEIQHADEQEDDDSPYRDPEDFAEEPVNPVVVDSPIELDDEDQREQFQEDYDLELDEHDRVFRGNFLSQDSSSIAVYRPGDAVNFYDDDRLFASLDIEEHYEDVTAPEDLTDFAPGAVELVQDGTHQLKLIHAEIDEDDRHVYHLNLYKVIGSEIAKIFSQPVGIEDPEGEVRPIAELQFLHGVEDRRIKWTPLTEEGEPEGDPKQYRWNRWEGVYRVPQPLPTAPGYGETPDS